MAEALKWIPMRSAAKMLGVSRQRVAKLCDEGKLVSQNMDRTVLVSVDSIRARIAGFQRTLGV